MKVRDIRSQNKIEILLFLLKFSYISIWRRGLSRTLGDHHRTGTFPVFNKTLDNKPITTTDTLFIDITSRCLILTASAMNKSSTNSSKWLYSSNKKPSRSHVNPHQGKTKELTIRQTKNSPSKKHRPR